MGIVDEDVARVREATDLVGLVTEHLALKRVGTNWVGLCPFHGEKSPSFSVSPEKGFFHCFGCGKSGDCFTFLQEIDNVDFPVAVETLAARVNITLTYTDEKQGEGRRRRSQLVEVMEAAVEWYHQRLLTSPDAGPARSYLRSRGLGGDVVRQFRIGYAPDGWDLLAKALRKHGELVQEAGLAFVNQRGRQQDFFRDRLLFPIFDAQGDPVSFGGRIMPGNTGPKYRNTSETPLYHKSRVLYGLNWAKNEVVKVDRVIICEGYTDVIGFATAGLPVAVATCGTSLTEEHVKLLRRFSRRMLLAFDPDKAGQDAAARVYAWEKAHDIDVSVVELPAGDDPADLARRDPEALRAAVESARPFLGFRVERVLAAGDLSTPEGRARTAENALSVISEHPSEFVRDPYVKVVADRCQLDRERLRQRLIDGVPLPAPKLAVGRPAERDPEPSRRASRPVTPVEVEALRMTVHHAELLLGWLAPELFDDPVARAGFEALAAGGGDLHLAVASVGPDVAELLARLAVEEPDAEPADVACGLVDRAARRAQAELGAESRRAGDARFAEFSAPMSWLKLQIEQLTEDRAAGLPPREQLVAWLVKRAGERA